MKNESRFEWQNKRNYFKATFMNITIDFNLSSLFRHFLCSLSEQKVMSKMILK